jgi:hypothetical protein
MTKKERENGRDMEGWNNGMKGKADENKELVKEQRKAKRICKILDSHGSDLYEY